MKNLTPKRELLDGYIDIYNPKEKFNSFSAAITPKSKEDMTYVCSLAYKEMSKREQDIEFAKSVERELSLKVKTHICPYVNNRCKCIILNNLYDIIKMDYNKDKDELYLYLEEVGKIESAP